ncbi:hypothetical protein [Gracilimonas sp. BCB1]|uniref:hypothetical protein n=1 Tax=Gracilimonas sp. BCB1 TaxID=3152362 RepID=UPI0032D8DA98
MLTGTHLTLNEHLTIGNTLFRYTSKGVQPFLTLPINRDAVNDSLAYRNTTHPNHHLSIGHPLFQ